MKRNKTAQTGYGKNKDKDTHRRNSEENKAEINQAKSMFLKKK